MCGIIGFITNEKSRGAGDRRKFIEQALIVDTIRGDDSAGIFIVGDKMGKDEQADWFKSTGDGYTLVSHKEYQDRMMANKVADYRAVIGHNRAATIGTISVDNAHPFQEGPITLVHNGTLYNTHNMETPMWKLKDKGVAVDSHAICHNLATHDPKEVIGKLDGTFALIWHDARDNTVNICRNEKRPLHMLYATCEDTLLLASEAEMLFWLAKRNNFHFDHVVTPKPMQWLKYRAGSLIPEVIEVPFVRPAWGRSPNGEGRTHTSATRSATTRTTTTRRSLPWDYEAIPLEAETMLLDVGADSITPLRFIPSKIVPVEGLHTAVVSGVLCIPDAPNVTGMVCGLDYKAVKDSADNNEIWTVYPQAVRKVEDADNPNVVMCRMSSRRWVDPLPRNSDTSATATSGTRRRHGWALRLGARTHNEYVPGPHDEWIPVHEWMNHTADGCFQCGQEICADDAEEVQWVSGGARPLCPECVGDAEAMLDKAYEKGNY